MLCPDGEWVQVEHLRQTAEVVVVYNVKVADHHTYFVGCDEWQFAVWAHNQYGATEAANAQFEAEVYDRLRAEGLTQADARDLAQLGAADGTQGQLLSQAINNGDIAANYAADAFDPAAMERWNAYRTELEAQMTAGVEPPTTTGELGGTPLNPLDDPANANAILRENQAAQGLAAQYGYDVVVQPPGVGPANPDYLIQGAGIRVGGEYFDAYAPQASNLDTIWNTVNQKVGRQSPNVILILDDTTLTTQQILENFTGGSAIPRLRRLWVMQGGVLTELINNL